MSELDGPVITDPAMYSDDREARKRRAEYVHAAVDGRNATSGEETTIPILRSDDGRRDPAVVSLKSRTRIFTGKMTDVYAVLVRRWIHGR